MMKFAWEMIQMIVQVKFVHPSNRYHWNRQERKEIDPFVIFIDLVNDWKNQIVFYLWSVCDGMKYRNFREKWEMEENFINKIAWKRMQAKGSIRNKEPQKHQTRVN